MSETPRSHDTKNMDIPALEMAFAKDPTSDVFVALATAYLAQGRFTEAMVVCKKGIKTKPDDVNARLLLARVYAEQGKIPKALEEVKGLLASHGSVADVHAYHGELLEKGGRGDDYLAGGTGSDTFVFNLYDGADLVSDFRVGLDHIDLSATGISSEFGLVVSDITINGVLSTEIDYGTGTIKLFGVDQDLLSATGFNDFLFA